MQAVSRLRIASLLMAFALLVLLGGAGCSDKTTDASRLPEEEPEDDQVVITHKIGFIDSDFIGPAVEQYAYGDSIYIRALEKNLWPTYSPVWLYSYRHHDMEVFLMDDDRAPSLPIFEAYMVVIAVLPDTMTGYGPFPFDGTLTVTTGGDSITAYYFSQTHGQIISAGVRIGGSLSANMSETPYLL